MEIGKLIKKLRVENNMTQEELGAKLFVTRNAVSKWESDRGTPSIDNLKSICKLFSISLDDLTADSTTDSKDLSDSFKHSWFVICTSIISFFIYLIQMSEYSYSMTLFLAIQFVIYVISSFIVLILNLNKPKQKNYLFWLYLPIILTLITQGIIGLLIEL